MNTLSNQEINDLVKKKRLHGFHGCFMSDSIPGDLKQGSYIINIDKTGGEGTHWTSLCIGRGGNCFYFDSFGQPAPQILDNQITPYSFNNRQLQDYKSSSCGFYCLAFIQYMSRRGINEDNFKKFLSFFRSYPSNEYNEFILNQFLK